MVCSKISVLGTMEGLEGGSSTPSYSHVVFNHFKKPVEGETGCTERGKQENNIAQKMAETQEEVRREKHTEADSHKFDPRIRT